MNNKTQTTLRFFLGGILMITFAATGCNNNGEAEKTVTIDTIKTVMPAPVLKDTLKDTMEVTPGNVSPTPGGN